MKFLKICLFNLLSIVIGSNNVINSPNNTILLNTTNFINLQGPITEESAAKFILDLNLFDRKSRSNKIVYIDSPGGSVLAGVKIIDQIEKYQISCIASKAISMGFVIFQSCHNRLVTSSSQLMQHQISFGIKDEIRKIESHLDFIQQIEDQLVDKQIQKMNISKDHFNQLINNEWWTYGVNNLIDYPKLADKLISVECSKELTQKKKYLDKKYLREVWSGCPLITIPIEIIGKEQSKHFFF